MIIQHGHHWYQLLKKLNIKSGNFSKIVSRHRFFTFFFALVVASPIVKGALAASESLMQGAIGALAAVKSLMKGAIGALAGVKSLMKGAIGTSATLPAESEANLGK